MITREDALRELIRRKRIREHLEQMRAATLAPLSARQRAFVEDTSRRQTVVTSRQSGKTTCLESKLCIGAQSIEQADLVYVATKRDAARDPFWERLKLFVEKNKIPAKPNETMLEMRFEGKRSKISLRGVPDIKLANRLRGPTRHGAAVDESQNYPDDVLRTLVIDVLEPSLMVHNGWLALGGTPGLQPKGFFYDCHKSPGYSHHEWGLESNPLFDGRVDEIIADVLLRNSWTRESPTFRREYLGEWCADTEAAVYRVTEANLYNNLPEGEWRYVLGVDFGYRDEAAFVVVGWRNHDPTLYVVHEDSDQELLVDDYVSRIRELIKTYAPVAIVADAGALGKTLVETLMHNHGLPIEAADKRDKPMAIRQVNADLFKGAIKMTRSGLFEQMSTLRWHPEKIGLMEQPGMANDRCDAFLYAYRRAYHYIEKPKPPQIKHGTAEYFAKIEREIREQQYREATRDPFAVDPWARD